jgi:hypothetical protein
VVAFNIRSDMGEAQPEPQEQPKKVPTVSTETLIDVIYLTGLVFLLTGLGLAVGWGWGLAADGAILTATGLWLGGKK